VDYLGILKRYRKLKIGTLLFLLVLLSNAFLFIGFVFPHKMKRSETVFQWEESRKKLNRMHSLKNAEVQLKGWKELLKSKEDFSETISSISKTAKRHRIDIPSISYQQQDLELKGLSKISFSFTINNRYDRIRKFIYDLETSEEFLIIEELVVENSAKKESQDVEAQMKVSTFLVERRVG
jgi:hypothetical protein